MTCALEDDDELIYSSDEEELVPYVLVMGRSLNGKPMTLSVKQSDKFGKELLRKYNKTFQNIPLQVHSMHLLVSIDPD